MVHVLLQTSFNIVVSPPFHYLSSSPLISLLDSHKATCLFYLCPHCSWSLIFYREAREILIIFKTIMYFSCLKFFDICLLLVGKKQTKFNICLFLLGKKTKFLNIKHKRNCGLCLCALLTLCTRPRSVTREMCGCVCWGDHTGLSEAITVSTSPML